MNDYWDFFSRLAPLPRHINSPGYDESIKSIASRYGLDLIRYDQSAEHNGWVIPPKYHVSRAEILHKGVVVFDGTQHALGVISHSSSFQGVVSRQELVEHCYTDVRDRKWIPYHFRQSYRPWQRDWGFCMSQDQLDTLTAPEYEVAILVEEGPRELLLARGLHAGSSDIRFVLSAHLDHPGMANDDLSGVMVICEAFRRLSKEDLVFGLEVLVVPEIIGTQFHLFADPRHVALEGLFIESIGRPGAFRLQKSRSPVSLMEDVVMRVLSQADPASKLVEYQEYYGNDEKVFEAYGCPMPSLTRGVFAGYHSSADSFDALSRDLVEETIQTIVDVVRALQRSILIRKNFRGLVALANPEYDLYPEPGQIAFGVLADDKELWCVMDHLSSCPKSVLSLAEIVGTCGSDPEKTLQYLEAWADKGLIELIVADR